MGPSDLVPAAMAAPAIPTSRQALLAGSRRALLVGAPLGGALLPCSCFPAALDGELACDSVGKGLGQVGE